MIEEGARNGRGVSRRALLLSTLLAGVAAPALARTITGGVPWTPGRVDAPPLFDGARFFTQPERAAVDAITARLIPTDDRGPGAREAGVVDFIDNQLAGFYGRGERWYMQGPFADGTDEQGYQQPYPPAGLYRAALAELDRVCRRDFAGRAFVDLPESDQDAVLKRLDEGELAFEGVSATTFFELVLENAIEGFFCDPLYGGNRDMVGWKLVGFPGARYDYRDFLDHDGAAIALEPVGLQGRPAWNVE